MEAEAVEVSWRPFKVVVEEEVVVLLVEAVEGCWQPSRLVGEAVDPIANRHTFHDDISTLCVG